jgi:hypothetical protein
MISPSHNEKDPALHPSDDELTALDGDRTRKWNELRPELQQLRPYTRRPWLLSVVYLLFLVFLLQHIYIETSSSTISKDDKFDRPVKSRESLHFAPLNDGLSSPSGLFIDDNKTWHAYFQGWIHV